MPRKLQSKIHSDFSINSNDWTQYRQEIKTLFDASTSKVDFNDHLIREYNRKINKLSQETGLYISPFDGGFRFIGNAIPSTLLSGLTAFWELDETSNIRYDSHNGYDLTPEVGQPDIGSTNGVIGNAADFTGGWLFSNHTFDLASSGFSISTWLNGIATNVGPAVSQWQTGNGFIIGIDSATFATNEFTFVLGNNPASYINKYSYNTGWHHIVGTYDPTIGTSKLYVDSVLRDTVTGIPSIPLNGSANFKMGTIDAGGEFVYDGLIDSSALWLRPLTQSEVTFLYNNDNGLSYEKF